MKMKDERYMPSVEIFAQAFLGWTDAEIGATPRPLSWRFYSTMLTLREMLEAFDRDGRLSEQLSWIMDTDLEEFSAEVSRAALEIGTAPIPETVDEA
jgi:hypothetical protein